MNHRKARKPAPNSVEQGEADRLEAPLRTTDNLAIDSKLRGCDVVSLKVEDVAPHGITVDRATVRQRKTGHPVRSWSRRRTSPSFALTATP